MSELRKDPTSICNAETSLYGRIGEEARGLIAALARQDQPAIAHHGARGLRNLDIG